VQSSLFSSLEISVTPAGKLFGLPELTAPFEDLGEAPLNVRKPIEPLNSNSWIGAALHPKVLGRSASFHRGVQAAFCGFQSFIYA